MTSHGPGAAKWQDERVLRVYVASHCDTCRESQRLAGVVTARLPEITVELVDVDRDEAPGEIFAVPTFWYRDQRLSLGNPSADDLCQRILQAERKLSGVSLRSGDTGCALDEKGRGFPPRLARSSIVAPICGATGLAGTILCSASMVAFMAGLFAAELHSGARSTNDLTPAPSVIAVLIRFGPEILLASILLVITASAIQQPIGVLPATLGGLVLYLGMYAQSVPGIAYGTMVAGLILLGLAYALVVRPRIIPGFTLLRL